MKRNKVKFITPLKMVRKATNILLRITSENNERFSSPVILRLSLIQLKCQDLLNKE